MYLTPFSIFLLFARLVQGIAVNITTAATELFILETSHEDIRGKLMASLSFSRYMGAVFIFGIGATMISWRLQALISCLVSAVPSFILLFFFPTSPRFLVAKKKLKDAEKSLIFYRGQHKDIKDEMDKIKFVLQSTESQGFVMQIKFLMRKKVLKNFSLLLLIAAGTQFSGQGIFLAYVGPIIEEAMPQSNPFLWSIVMSLVRVVGSIVFGILTIFSRRIIFLIFCLLSVVSLLLFGVDQFIMYSLELQVFPWWVSIICLCSLMIFVSILTPTAVLMIGEILPTTCRSLGYVITDLTFYLSYFMITFTFPFLKDLIHMHGVLWLYSVLIFLVAWVPLLYLPETKGKNLEDIQIKLYS